MGNKHSSDPPFHHSHNNIHYHQPPPSMQQHPPMYYHSHHSQWAGPGPYSNGNGYGSPPVEEYRNGKATTTTVEGKWRDGNAPRQQQKQNGRTTTPTATPTATARNPSPPAATTPRGSNHSGSAGAVTGAVVENGSTAAASPAHTSSPSSAASPADVAASPTPPTASRTPASDEGGTAPPTPAASQTSVKKGFLAQLFSGRHHQQKKASIVADEKNNNNKPLNGLIVVPPPSSQPQQHQTLPEATSPPMAPQLADALRQQSQQPFVLLADRPAIRLDSRLVCKYEVLAVVGKGSFSQVLRVQDRISKRYYAVKLVSTEQDFAGAVNNELSILSRVQHPFVIRLEEVFRSATKLFIVMEMASGGEMYDRVVSKGRYTETEARLAIKMLLSGLDYLHGMLITHRDLKPENLLYSEPRQDARLLITDFGLAHQARVPDEKMAETCGTPEYIAPEILLRIPYTNKVDLWAVGVIAYILMSGIMPFDDDCRSRLYTHIITANYVYYAQFWSGSDAAKHFVDTLLDTSPEHRPTAGEALRHHWLTGERQPHTPTAGKRPLRTRRREGATGDAAAADSDAADADADAEDGGTTSVSAADANGTTVQRTKSSRSVRSVTRSDHGHRVDPREVDQLAEDLQRLAQKQRERERRARTEAGGGTRRHHYSSPYANGHNSNRQQQQHRYSNHQAPPPPVTKNYGVF